MIKKLSAALLLSLLTLSAQADVFHFKDGRKVEGKLLEERGGLLIVQIRSGSSTAKARFRRSEIRSIERKLSEWDLLKNEYRKRFTAAIASGDNDQFEKLADWCDKNKLYTQKRDALQRAFRIREAQARSFNTVSAWRDLLSWTTLVKLDKRSFIERVSKTILQLDPNNREARMALGFKEINGKWYDATQYPAAYAQHMKAQGFVKFQGQWYKPDQLTAYAKALAAQAQVAQLKELKRANAQLQRDNQALLAQSRELQNSVNAALREVSAMRAEVNALRRERAELANLRALVASQRRLVRGYERRICDLERRPACRGHDRNRRR